MIKTNLRTVTVGIALLVGMALGLTVPKQAAATSYLYELALHPSGSSTFLSCGWHSGACWDAPTPVPSGPALDWKPQQDPVHSGFAVYFVAKTAASGGQAAAGTAQKITEFNQQCKHYVRVDIKDPGGTIRARTRYVHTLIYGTSGGWFAINSGYYPQTTNQRVGTTVGEPGCAWNGYHVHHEYGWNFSATANYPDEDRCNWSNVSYECGYYSTHIYPSALTSWWYP